MISKTFIITHTSALCFNLYHSVCLMVIPPPDASCHHVTFSIRTGIVLYAGRVVLSLKISSMSGQLLMISNAVIGFEALMALIDKTSMFSIKLQSLHNFGLGMKLNRGLVTYGCKCNVIL